MLKHRNIIQYQKNQIEGKFGFKVLADLAFCFGSTTPHHGFSVSSNQQQQVFVYMEKVSLVRQCNLGHHHLFGFKSQPVSSGHLLENHLGTRPGLYWPAFELMGDLQQLVVAPDYESDYESRTIRPRRGVLQGSILSPILYAVFIDSLPRQLRLGLESSEYQASPSLLVSTVATNDVSEFQLQDFDHHTLRDPARRTYQRITTNILFYADDVAIIGTTAEVRMLLVLAQLHSERYGYRWSPPKCTILNASSSSRYRLYGQELQRVTYFKYLGIIFTGKGIDVTRTVQASATKGVQAMGLLHNLGAHKYAFGLGVSLRLYRTFIRPVIEYGLAIAHTTNIKHLERAQERYIRLAFNVQDPNAHTPTIQAKVMADLPSMKLRSRILEFKFVVLPMSCHLNKCNLNL
ncbi:hypothetical protein O0I10_009995 [Lichtheimia ornata]|uniref:Reverse transcriptase domain-containing protein n=1 Tax=Lichtheimia ornata TaxID=688661 RepID=A0AAD7UXJ9_9FUNG|nr:uncharacterized protein O0I10_009995 [Lichtheimia ornata]KAJ8654300.1 hypothetical protein O0I10_009995 [Lichtheimia ornata]